MSIEHLTDDELAALEALDSESLASFADTLSPSEADAN